MSQPHAHAGKSLIEIIWEELDTVLDRLMSDGEPNEEVYAEEFIDKSVSGAEGKADALHWRDKIREWGEERGQAQGLAFALAVLTNPYEVNVDAIREQAMERWEQANSD